jgi:hypothetical protein
VRGTTQQRERARVSKEWQSSIDWLLLVTRDLRASGLMTNANYGKLAARHAQGRASVRPLLDEKRWSVRRGLCSRIVLAIGLLAQLPSVATFRTLLVFVGGTFANAPPLLLPGRSPINSFP